MLLLEPNLKLEQVHADNIKVGAPISQQIIVPCIELLKLGRFYYGTELGGDRNSKENDDAPNSISVNV